MYDWLPGYNEQRWLLFVFADKIEVQNVEKAYKYIFESLLLQDNSHAYKKKQADQTQNSALLKFCNPQLVHQS